MFHVLQNHTVVECLGISEYVHHGRRDWFCVECFAVCDGEDGTTSASFKCRAVLEGRGQGSSERVGALIIDRAGIINI